MTQTPRADAVVGTNTYRPDIAQASAALNAVLNQGLPAPGTMLYDPEEIARSSNPTPWITQKNQLGSYTSRWVAETVAQLQGDINRAITTSTGFAPYVLESPAKVIFPVEAPLVRMTPRQVGKGTDIEHWKSVLSIFNQGGPFSQTNLGGTSDGSMTLQSPVYVVNPYQATYQTIAEYNSVTFQAQWRSRALEGDMLARRKMELLYALKLQEENWLINGASLLWAPAPPLVTASITGGSLVGSAGPYWVQIAAVNSNGSTTPSAMVGPITLASTSAGSLSILWSGVINATSYKIYIGTGATKPANSAMFICVAGDFASAATPVQPTDYIGSMSIATTLVTAPTSGVNPVTVNGATVSLNLFDGAQSLCYLNPNGLGSNLSVGEQAMTAVITQPNASSGLLSMSDLQHMFRLQYSQARAHPSHLFVSPVEAVTIDNLVGTAPNFRIIAEPNSAGAISTITAGQKVTKILNQVTGDYVDVVTLPFLPQGTIMAGSFALPFPSPSGILDPVFRVMINQDYTSVDYPPSQANPQTWGFGYFVDECLVNQYIGGWAVLQGIQPAAGV